MIELLAGGGLALVGVALGRLQRPGKKDPPARCSCNHGIGFHEGKTGACGYQDERYVSGVGATTYQCRCRHYDGPIPVETYLAPPLLPPREG